MLSDAINNINEYKDFVHELTMAVKVVHLSWIGQKSILFF